MRSTFKILFYINRQKTKADGMTAILCRITIDGKQSVITTNEECKPTEWNTKQGATTNKKTNLRLQAFRELVEKTYQELLLKDEVVSAELLKNSLQGIATSFSTLLGLGRAELQTVKEGVGKSKTEGTYTNLCYANRRLCEFVKDKGNEDIDIRTITEELFEEYRFFLRKKGLKGSTINNYLCWLSRLMFRAVSLRIIRYNPFEHAEYEKEEKTIRFLSKSDVAKLMAIKICDSDAELAREMFIFSCFTGLAITDMERLKFGHIKGAADGQMYIRKERQKTKVEFIVPLHPIAKAIIEQQRKIQTMKEEDNNTVMDNRLIFQPCCSRSVLAKQLSIVGKACGLKQRLSYHMGRHTFGTMNLSAGIPIESIAKMMGHASIASTQIYAQVTDCKISEDMDRLIEKLSSKEKENKELVGKEPLNVLTYKMEETGKSARETEK